MSVSTCKGLWKLKQKEGSVVEDFKDSKAISLGNSLACGVFHLQIATQSPSAHHYTVTLWAFS